MLPDEKPLIKACLKGNRQAQEELYNKYAPAMYVVCKRYSKAQQEAEDILQESFIKVFKQLKTFKGDVAIGGWIKKIIINTALNHQRSKIYMFPMVDVDELKNTTNSDSLKLSEYSMEELLQMINDLPERAKQLLRHKIIEIRKGYGRG